MIDNNGHFHKVFDSECFRLILSIIVWQINHFQCLTGISRPKSHSNNYFILCDWLRITLKKPVPFSEIAVTREIFVLHVTLKEKYQLIFSRWLKSFFCLQFFDLSRCFFSSIVFFLSYMMPSFEIRFIAKADGKYTSDGRLSQR